MLFVSTSEANDFKVYGYMTPEAGETEWALWTEYVIQSDNTQDFFEKTGVKRKGLWDHSVELEYGVTDRWTIAGYADFEQPDGEGLKYIQASAVLSRYRFFEKGERFLDGAIYLEYYFPDPGYLGGVSEERIEARIILEKDFTKTTFSLNPKFEKVLSGPDVVKGTEFEYAASVYQKENLLRAGLELYGTLGEWGRFESMDRQKHYLVPAVKWKVTDHLEWNLGVALGLTDSSDDVVAKSIIEWEL